MTGRIFNFLVVGLEFETDYSRGSEVCDRFTAGDKLRVHLNSPPVPTPLKFAAHKQREE